MKEVLFAQNGKGLTCGRLIEVLQQYDPEDEVMISQGKQNGPLYHIKETTANTSWGADNEICFLEMGEKK